MLLINAQGFNFGQVLIAGNSIVYRFLFALSGHEEFYWPIVFILKSSSYSRLRMQNRFIWSQISNRWYLIQHLVRVWNLSFLEDSMALLYYISKVGGEISDNGNMLTIFLVIIWVVVRDRGPFRWDVSELRIFLSWYGSHHLLKEQQYQHYYHHKTEKSRVSRFLNNWNATSPLGSITILLKIWLFTNNFNH